MAAQRCVSLPAVVLVSSLAVLPACGESNSGSKGGAAAGSNAGGSTGDGGSGGGGRSGDGGSESTVGGTGAGAGGTSAAGAPACAAPNVAVSRNDPQTFPEAGAQPPGEHQFFRITVKSAGDGSPLRGAHLRTVNEIDLVTDDNGVVAFYEPGLMGQEVYFAVTHPGYELAADGFGNRGKALVAMEGGSAELALTKTSGTLAAVQGDLASRLAAGKVPGPAQCFTLRVFDDQTKRGVPLVRLQAFGESYWTDSQGLVAYCNPDHLPAKAASFQVWSHGYALDAGKTEVLLDAGAGMHAEIPIHRQIVAERLYRLTGGGIYRDSVLLGYHTPLAKPTLNASVMGQDTSSSTVYRGKLFWLWQDTQRVSYPLGNFKGTAAISALPDGKADLGFDLGYIENGSGFSAEMCADCPGGPAWLDGLFSATAANGDEQLFGGYAIIAGDGSIQETGMVRFDDASQRFVRVIKDFSTRADFDRPSSHPFGLRHGDARYAYYENRLRIVGKSEAFLDPTQYERFTPYPAGATQPLLNAAGKPDYAWRANGLNVSPERLNANAIGAEQSLGGHLLRAGEATPLELVGVTTGYHPYRGRFLLAGQEKFGNPSALGEIWQAEADTPMGPWLYAAKIISHQDYTFYNTLYHPELARGSFAYIEGTYTASYSGAKELTPRYNYNQLLYRVDLEQPALTLPVAVYELEPQQRTHLGTKRELRPGAAPVAAEFLAYDRLSAGTRAVAFTDASCRADRRLVLSDTPKTAPLFYALPPDAAMPKGGVKLFEATHADGRHAYAVEGAALPTGFVRAATPLAWVIENPVAVALPVADYLPELIADAGSDQCLDAGAGDALVKLDAKATLSQAKVTRYLWHVPGAPGCEYIEGAQAQLALPAGIYAVELEVTDDAGHVSRDTLTISVR